MIPKHFYFIYLYGPETYEFNHYHYVSLASNIEINKPEKVTIITNKFNRFKNNFYVSLALLKYHDTPIEIVDLKDLYNQIPGLDIENYLGNHVPYMSHQADILKNELIRNFGGIYSDFDSIALKPFPEEWYESNKSIFCAEEDNGEIVGICAGFFLGVKNCPFITANLSRYKDYDENEVKPKTANWAKFAVQLPLDSYRSNPDNISLISAKYLEPLYTYYHDVDLLFFRNKNNRELEDRVRDAYQLHLWENRNGYILRTYSPSSIMQDRDTKYYASIAAQYLIINKDG